MVEDTTIKLVVDTVVESIKEVDTVVEAEVEA